MAGPSTLEYEAPSRVVKTTPSRTYDAALVLAVCRSMEAADPVRSGGRRKRRFAAHDELGLAFYLDVPTDCVAGLLAMLDSGGRPDDLDMRLQATVVGTPTSWPPPPSCSLARPDGPPQWSGKASTSARSHPQATGNSSALRSWTCFDHWSRTCAVGCARSYVELVSHGACAMVQVPAPRPEVMAARRREPAPPTLVSGRCPSCHQRTPDRPMS
jgi:hypothetical protein